ncbi:MAG: helix-turn-helix domain-containing protein [Gemmatimonadota bacterium]|jgi:putative transcriptional regulator
MNDELYEELLESVREGGAILRGETGASRSWAVEEPRVAEIRAQYGLSQARFATLLGISVRTLQNWEQGRRSPQGPAKVLLQVAAEHPDALLDLLRRTS